MRTKRKSTTTAPRGKPAAATPRFKRFGEMLRNARKNRKLTQGELAASLGVLQQAVSGWERGTSRPETATQVEAIAAFFPEHPRQEWLKVSGHVKRGTAAAPAPPPARPLSATLPLQALTFEQFQDFCASLLEAYYEGATVHQYGVPGDKQLGIDIDVTLKDSTHYTFQCKREQRFGKEKVRKAIKEHRVDCDFAVILLSRPATAEARDEIKRKRKKKWDLWDSKDIAERIRSLSEIKRLRLIDTYFPAHRKDFLGVELPTVFESAERYYAPFLKRTHIFSHAWTLVGRQAEFAKISAALAGTNEGAILIAGAGGVGKTRLLRSVIEEFRKQHPDVPVSILPSTAQPLPRDYEIVGSQSGVVVIEDAHDRIDIKAVAHALARTRASQRVIVTCRPYALSATRGDLESAGLPVAPGFPVTITGLTVNDAETVAREVLEAAGGPSAAARDIAIVTHDSPLALVIGAHLVATKRIHPRTLNNAEEFRQKLSGRFRDAITGIIGLPADQRLIRSTLELIALLQPIDIDTRAFTAIVAKLVPEPIQEIKRAIQLLIEGGVLVRRARKLRIVPDLLGDFLIGEVLRREGGAHCATIERLLSEADAEHVARLLVNTSKLDWRLSAKDEGDRPLSDRIWDQLIVGGTNSLPEKLVEGIITSAYFQPAQALRLYDRIAVSGPLPREFSRLLRHVAMNIDYVESACQRLWTLAQSDRRAENQFPEHPMRILKELAEIQPSKPVAYCEKIVDFAMARILARGDTLRLYEVLEAGLNADGHTTESRGLTISFRPFAVRHSAVRELRMKIINFLLDRLRSPQLPSAVRAAAALSSALRFPDRTTPEARKEWEKEFVTTLDRLAEVMKSGQLDANTLVQIEKSVHWHAAYGEGPAHEAAKRVLANIPQSLDYRVTLAMIDAWGNTRMSRSSRGWIEQWRNEMAEIGKELLKAHSDSAAVIAFVRAKLATIRAAGDQRDVSPGQFVSQLCSLDQQVAKAFCEVAIREPELRALFSAALFALMSLSPDEGVLMAKLALDSGIPELARDIAWCFSVRQEREKTVPEERTMLASFLSHADEHVVASAIRGVVNGGLSDPSALAATLLRVDFRDSKHIASEFFQEVVNHEDLRHAVLVPELIPDALAKIQNLTSIDDFWIEKFLSIASEVAPVALVDFLLKRIDHEISETKPEIQPLPYLWDDKLPLQARASTRFKEALRRIREWMLAAPDHWAVRFWGPKLYVAVAGGVDEEIIRDLLEWTDTHDPAKFDVVTHLLRDAPSKFVLENVPSVSALFERAEAISAEAVADLRSSLFTSAWSGMRHGTPGQPFPEDVARKTKSEEALARLPSGSPVAEFYRGLARDAEIDIRQKREEDEALIEEYE